MKVGASLKTAFKSKDVGLPAKEEYARITGRLQGGAHKKRPDEKTNGNRFFERFVRGRGVFNPRRTG